MSEVPLYVQRSRGLYTTDASLFFIVIVYFSSRTEIEVLNTCRNVKRFRGGLVFKAHRRVYHSTLGLRVIKKKRRNQLLNLPDLPFDFALISAKTGCIQGKSPPFPTIPSKVVRSGARDGPRRTFGKSKGWFERLSSTQSRPVLCRDGAGFLRALLLLLYYSPA